MPGLQAFDQHLSIVSSFLGYHLGFDFVDATGVVDKSCALDSNSRNVKQRVSAQRFVVTNTQNSVGTKSLGVVQQTFKGRTLDSNLLRNYLVALK